MKNYYHSYHEHREKEKIYQLYQKGKKAVKIGTVLLSFGLAIYGINKIFEEKPTYHLPTHRVVQTMEPYLLQPSQDIVQTLEEKIKDIQSTKKAIEWATDPYYDSLATAMTEALSMHNILQERSYYENIIQRFPKEKLASLYQNAEKSYQLIQSLPLNVYTQQLQENQQITIKYYNHHEKTLISYLLTFKEGGGISEDDKGHFYPREREISYLAIKEKNGTLMQAKSGTFSYNPQKKWTVGELIRFIEKDKG